MRLVALFTMLAASLPSLALAQSEVEVPAALPVAAPVLFNRAMVMSIEEEVRRIGAPSRPRPPLPRSWSSTMFLGTTGSLHVSGEADLELSSYGAATGVLWQPSRYLHVGPEVAYTRWRHEGAIATGSMFSLHAQARLAYPAILQPFVQLGVGATYSTVDVDSLGGGGFEVTGGGSYGLSYEASGGVSLRPGDTTFVVAFAWRGAQVRHDVVRFDPTTGEAAMDTESIELGLPVFVMGMAIPL